MKTKRLLVVLLCLAAIVALAACASSPNSADSNELSPDGQIDMGVGGDNVEVNLSDVHMDAAEAAAAGNWEAMFTPVPAEGRASDYLDFDLTPTEEELEAMKNEPAYGQTIRYELLEGCSSGTSIAEHLGYYEDAGINVEGVKGEHYVEALGTGQVHIAICHIATSIVPITNGVDITFVGGAHLACKSLYVLADSDYNTTEDLKGTAVAVPNGIGASDYNITSLMLDDDGINPLTDVTLTQVSADACVAAMQRGEISAALLSDVYAYSMLKDGTLKCISSMLDSDYAEVGICCALAMNGTFVKENPVHTKKLVQAIQKALCWMRENPEEASQTMLDLGLAAGDLKMNTMTNNSLQYGLSDDFTKKELQEIINRYIRLGLITSMDDPQAVMDLAWSPVL
ncbi:MAG: ABC transporter substrate-binding protein [Firmicutes bacterium]|nr:ABC transporter substrate-binding protein [Bacillota bacterium]